MARDENGRKVLKQYVKERSIGRGSYSKVALYRNVDTGGRVAVKVCDKARLSRIRTGLGCTALDDVRKEIRILSQLDHQRIVRLLEVVEDEEEEKLYMVLEYYPLGEVCQGTGPPGGVGEAVARGYFSDTLSALQYLHQHGVVHGDIKPENLLVAQDGHARVADFGVSQEFEGEDDIVTRSPGTPVYNAPECISSEDGRYSGRAADVWALGVTLFVLTCGEYPFVGQSLGDTYEQILHRPLSLPGHLSPPLRDLLSGLLTKDPAKRLSLQQAASHPWTMNAERKGTR